jgi:hypothetical protein
MGGVAGLAFAYAILRFGFQVDPFATSSRDRPVADTELHEPPMRQADAASHDPQEVATSGTGTEELGNSLVFPPSADTQPTGEAVTVDAQEQPTQSITDGRQSPSDVDAELTLARVNCESETQAARADVVNRYLELAALSAGTGDSKNVTLLREQMRLFEAHGIAIGREDMREALLEYYRRRHAAVTKLAAKYESQLQASFDDLDRVNRLKTELANFPVPGKLVSLRLLRSEDKYVQHENYLGTVHPAINDERQINATFELVPGLSNKDDVSFRSLNCEGHYLCHGDFRLRIGKCDNSKASLENSTFKQTKGLADDAGVSFEAVNWPGYYIRAKGVNLHLERNRGDQDLQFRDDATFVFTEPFYGAW